MSQTGQKDLVERVSAILVGELTQGGERDLSALRLDALESDVFGLADEISRRVAEDLLQEQARRLSKAPVACPTCQGELESKAPKRRVLLLRRGEAQWEEPVWRCPRCRRDFFPSVGCDGLPGGSGM